MDNTNIEILIELVKQNEDLWNLSKKGYKDVKAKARIWNTISKECGLEVKVIKKKWKRLRDSFFRELDKRETNSDQAAHQDPEEGWKYFQHLQFLRNCSRKRKSTSNYSNKEEANEYSAGNFVIEDPEPSTSMCDPTKGILRERTVIDGDVFMINEDALVSPPLPTTRRQIEADAITTSDSGSSNKKRLRSTSSSERLIEEVELVKTMTSLQQWMKNKESADEDDLFCKSMAAKLKKFPTLTKNRAKLHILTYLCNEEEKLLSNGKKGNTFYKEKNKFKY